MENFFQMRMNALYMGIGTIAGALSEPEVMKAVKSAVKEDDALRWNLINFRASLDAALGDLDPKQTKH